MPCAAICSDPKSNAESTEKGNQTRYGAATVPRIKNGRAFQFGKKKVDAGYDRGL